MKRQWFWYGRLPVSAGVVGVLGCLLLTGCGSQPAVSAPPPPPSISAAYPLQKKIVEWDSYTGRLEAVEFVEVRARVSGHLDSIHFEEGHLVKKGDLLFVIDPRPFMAERKQAQAQLVQSRAELEESNAMQIQAEAEKKRADAQLLLAQQQLDRVKRLVEQNVVTKDELDQSISEFDQAAANADLAKASITSALADIATAQGRIEVAEANLALAELNLEYTKVFAPVTGLISRREVTHGNLISGGTENATLLTTIVSQDPIHCYFDANEQELLKYTRLAKQGERLSSRDAKNPVYLELVDEQKFPHVGHMDFVDNRVDPNTGTMRARAIFRNEDQILQPGLFARVSIPGSAPYVATLIPDAAISSDQSEKFVYVIEQVEGQNVAQRRVIKVGPLIDGLRVVREGLSPEERIITAGLQLVMHGSAVTLEEGDIQALAIDDGLPDDYVTVPPDQWISRESIADREVEIPAVPTTKAIQVGGGKP